MSTLNLDIESMLLPISPDNPCGRNMEFEAIIDAIREARESDPDDLPQDEWSSSLRRADWLQVIHLSQTLISNDSKDLQVVCWLTEALLNQHGLVGLVTGLEFMQAFIQIYGQTCWPAPDEDGVSLHNNKLQWLDRHLSIVLMRLSLLNQPESSLEYWRQVQDFEHKVAMYPEQRKALLSDGDFSLHSFNRWAAGIPSVSLSHVAQHLTRAKVALTSFELHYQQHHADDMQGDILSTTRQTLDDMNTFLQRLGEQATPDYGDLMMLNVIDPNGPLVANADTDISRQTMSRDLAISQMLTIAHFFRQSEPSSPVPFLMERAARWANMSLTEWLDEMLQDDNSLRNINNVLKGTERT